MAMTHGAPGDGRAMRHAARDYAQTPLNVYWEMTQACALACRHCRAGAMPDPPPGELTPDEGLRFVRQLAGFGDPPPSLILTGGDPLLRRDLFAIIDEARMLGVPVSITPAATPLLTHHMLSRLVAHGVDGLGLSLDGSTAARHEGIRSVPGCFDLTTQAMAWAAELGMPIQVNTLVAAETADDLPAVYALLRERPGVVRWSLFFLIGVGRGAVLKPLAPADADRLMGWVYDTAKAAPFVVATTEAPSYRRVALERMRAEGLTPDEIRRTAVTRAFGIRDGNGIMFVSSTGDVCPAGFLPLPTGNVRRDDVVQLYREAPLFRSLRDPHRFHGRCGRCEYGTLCGGSRARAYVVTGDPLETDPLCSYEPRGHGAHAH